MSRTTGDWTVNQIADELDLSRQAVYRKIRRGEIPAYKVGHSVRIRAEDVETLRRPTNVTTPEKLNAELVTELCNAVNNWSPLAPEQREAIAAIVGRLTA